MVCMDTTCYKMEGNWEIGINCIPESDLYRVYNNHSI